MKIQIVLSRVEVSAFSAVACRAELSLAEAVVRCAVVAINMGYESPDEMQMALFEDGTAPAVIRGCLPCGLKIAA